MGAQLVEMGIQSTMTRLGQTPIRLPHPINVRTKSRPLLLVWKARLAWPGHNHTVTRYPSRTSSVRPLVRSMQIAHTGRFNGRLRAL